MHKIVGIMELRITFRGLNHGTCYRGKPTRNYGTKQCETTWADAGKGADHHGRCNDSGTDPKAKSSRWRLMPQVTLLGYKIILCTYAQKAFGSVSLINKVFANPTSPAKGRLVSTHVTQSESISLDVPRRETQAQVEYKQPSFLVGSRGIMVGPCKYEVVNYLQLSCDERNEK